MEGAMPVWCRGVFLLFGDACTNRATDLHQGSCSHLQSKCREWSWNCGGVLGEEGLLKGMSVILPLPTLIIPLSGVSPNALGTPGSWDCFLVRDWTAVSQVSLCGLCVQRVRLVSGERVCHMGAWAFHLLGMSISYLELAAGDVI